MARRGRTNGLVAAIVAATEPIESPAAKPARFFFAVPEQRDVVQLSREVADRLAALTPTIAPLSPIAPRDLLLTIPRRSIRDTPNAFDAARAIEAAFDLPMVEPEILHAVMPIEPGPIMLESAAGLMP